MAKVFVYGSLRMGFGNHRLINHSEHSEFIGYDTLNGSLYDCGHFPCFIQNDNEGPVVGEVYDVSVSTLKSLDSLEGYIKGNEENNFYNRKVITTANGHEVFYYEAGPYLRASKHPKVECGDWSKYFGRSASR